MPLGSLSGYFDYRIMFRSTSDPVMNSRCFFWGVFALVLVAVGLIGVVIFQLFISLDTQAINPPTDAAPNRTTQTPDGEKRILVSDGNDTRVFTTRASTVGEAFKENGVILQANDRTDPPLDTPIDGTISVKIVHPGEVRVQTAQGEIVINTTAQTVGDTLAEGGIIPQGLDYSEPPLESQIPRDNRIRFVRVRLDRSMTMKLTAYETSYKAVDDLEIGQRKDIQPGQQGVIVQGSVTRYEDGQVVTEEKIAEFTLSEPKERVIGYGTKTVKHTLEVPGGKIEYWQALTMYATSYSPCRLGISGYCHDTTASGAKLVKGVAALVRADYNMYKGSAVYVPGYGIAVISDIGAGVPGKRWIDLGFSDDDFETWARDVTVYFLWPPPAVNPEN